MRRGGRLGVAAGLAVMALVVLAGAAAAAGPEFVDQRAVVLDLDARPRGGPWRVDVVNATDKPTTISLQTAGVPSLTVTPATSPSVDPGRTTSFTVRLPPDAKPAAGQLLAVTATGATARRELRIEHGARTGPVPDVRLQGRRLAPLVGPLTVDSVESPRLAPTDGGVAVGVVQSAEGEQGQVVGDGGRVSVHGIRRPGEYTGTLSLGAGREAKVTVKVRDAFLWPALVLLAGLVLVGRLEQLSKRDLPRRKLHLRLERRRGELLAVQRRVAGEAPSVPSVTREQGSTAAFVFDNAVEAALREMAMAETDEAVAAWGETGAAYTKVVAFKDRCAKLLQDHGALATKLAAARRRLNTNDLLAEVPILDDVRDCLAVNAITNERDLGEHEARVSAQHETLATFTRTLELLDDMLRDPTLATADKETATTLRQTLLQSPGPLGAIAEDVATLATTVEREPVPMPVAVAPATAAAGADHVEVHVRDAESRALTRARGSRRLLPVLAGLAAVVAVVLAVPSLLLSGSDDEDTAPFRPTTTVPSSVPTTTAVPAPPLATTTTLPPAPTAVAPATVEPSDLDRSPSTAARWGWAVVLPLLLAALAYQLLSGPLRALGRKLVRSRTRGQDITALDAAVRNEERTFTYVSGLIVVLTGMSLLYFTDETFGSLGDYVKVLLWGSAVGEGVQLARRIVPRFGPATT